MLVFLCIIADPFSYLFEYSCSCPHKCPPSRAPFPDCIPKRLPSMALPGCCQAASDSCVLQKPTTDAPWQCPCGILHVLQAWLHVHGLVLWHVMFGLCIPVTWAATYPWDMHTDPCKDITAGLKSRCCVTSPHAIGINAAAALLTNRMTSTHRILNCGLGASNENRCVSESPRDLGHQKRTRNRVNRTSR